MMMRKSKALMTYRKLYRLKTEHGMSTIDLVRRFPRERDKITNLALLDLPQALLEETLTEKQMMRRVMTLRRRMFKIPA